MSHGRIGEVATGVIGNAAGTAVDPRQGMRRLRSRAAVPGLVVLGAAVGYLLGRRGRR